MNDPGPDRADAVAARGGSARATADPTPGGPQPATAIQDDATGGVWNALTVDVEEHFQVSNLEDSVPREDWDSEPSRVESNTIRLLELFDEAGVRATFFVLGWIAERKPRLVRQIAERGHELASHGHSHRLVYNQRPEEFREELRRAKDLVEQISGEAVRGHRAASFSIGRNNLWALDVIAECGFTYDSSLFPVVHDRYGVPGAPRHLYSVATPNGSRLVEVPPSTVSVGPWTLPMGGGGYLRLLPAAVSRWAITRLNRDEVRPAVIYVHPWEVDPAQPRVNNAPWMYRFRHYVNLRTTIPKLSTLFRHFRFTTVQDVVDRAGDLELVSLD